MVILVFQLLLSFVLVATLHRGQYARDLLGLSPRKQRANNWEQQQHYRKRTQDTATKANVNYFNTAKVPLVIGGSDGSGTRAFVELLAKLGVPMLLDDAGTMDINGGPLCAGQGWPPLAKLALQEKEYPVHKWPDSAQNQSQVEFEKLRDRLETRFERKMTKLQSLHKVNNSQLARKVLYGFKAPVTVVLVPMMQAHLYPKGFKYLHVVRDGRDIALSTNQSPVKKFYNSTYPDAADRIDQYRDMAPVLAMQLWNDWNADLYDWARKQNASSNFDYLVVRSEDLLNPETKLQTIQVLADFIGSQLTPQELCCVSRRDARDMGQSNSYNKKNHTVGMQQNEMHSGLIMAKAGDSKEEIVDTLARAANQEQSSVRKGRRRLPQDHRRLFGFELLEKRPAMDRHRPLTEGGRPNSPTPGAASRHKQIIEKFRNHTGRTPTREQIEKIVLARKIRLRNKRPVNRKQLEYGDEDLGKLIADQLQELYQNQNLSKNQTVTERYGKWATLLEPNSNLSRAIHREGARALKAFGYEPRRRFMTDQTRNSFVCNAAVECA